MENVLITGASTGIGYSLCQEYVNQGCRVIGSVRKAEDAKKLKDDLGPNFHALLFDVTDQKAVNDAVGDKYRQDKDDHHPGTVKGALDPAGQENISPGHR